MSVLAQRSRHQNEKKERGMERRKLVCVGSMTGSGKTAAGSLRMIREGILVQCCSSALRELTFPPPSCAGESSAKVQSSCRGSQTVRGVLFGCVRGMNVRFRGPTWPVRCSQKRAHRAGHRSIWPGAARFCKLRCGRKAAVTFDEIPVTY